MGVPAVAHALDNDHTGVGSDADGHSRVGCGGEVAGGQRGGLTARWAEFSLAG